MKKIFTFLLSACTFGAMAQTPFLPTSLVVYRVGDGAAPLRSVSTQVFLDEFSPTGTLIQSIAMPTQTNGSNVALTASGSSASEGLLTRSVNGKYLVLGGYNTDTGFAGVTGSAGSAIRRVVARVDAAASINTTTQLGVGDFLSSNIRGVASVDGSQFWMTGSGTGVRHCMFGDSGTRVSSSAIAANFRGIHIFDNQLYVTSTSGSTKGLFSVGTGLPVDTGTALTLIPGFPTSASPYQFFFADLSTAVPGVDVVYVADNGATAGGIFKYSLVGGAWVANGVVVPPVTGTSGLTGIVNLTTVALVTSTPSKLYSLIDATGYNQTIVATFTELATAATNTAFRGVAIAPNSGLVPLKIISFKAILSAEGVNLNWISANEVNAKDFWIERSKDGIHYTAINTIGAKNTAEATYSFLDKTPFDGINYYRLKMNDNNGSFKYSEVNTVVNHRGVKADVFPNPALSSITVSHSKAINGATITINTAGGQLVKTMTVETGAVQTKISIDNFVRGHYIVTFNNNGEKAVTKFMKQ